MVKGSVLNTQGQDDLRGIVEVKTKLHSFFSIDMFEHILNCLLLLLLFGMACITFCRVFYLLFLMSLKIVTKEMLIINTSDL